MIKIPSLIGVWWSNCTKKNSTLPTHRAGGHTSLGGIPCPDLNQAGGRKDAPSILYILFRGGFEEFRGGATFFPRDGTAAGSPGVRDPIAVGAGAGATRRLSISWRPKPFKSAQLWPKLDLSVVNDALDNLTASF